MTIQLGQTARDKISGFEGVVIARHEYLHGCTRISLQPKSLHEGKPIDAHTFDEPQVDLIAAPLLPPRKQSDKPGGPRPEPKRHAIPSRS